jgi:phosphomannomutase
VGICLDGDADRVIIIDETGAAADGDQIMALFAARMAEEGHPLRRHAGRDGDVEPRARALSWARGA